MKFGMKKIGKFGKGTTKFVGKSAKSTTKFIGKSAKSVGSALSGPFMTILIIGGVLVVGGGAIYIMYR
jgi:hypothetical protein